MIELLALPVWDAPPRSVDDWRGALAGRGYEPRLEREASDECWLVVAPLRLRGYVVMEGDRVSAINFELTDPEPAAATRLLEEAAGELGWEIHPDDEEVDDLEGD